MILMFGAAALTGILLAYLLVVLYFFPTEPEVPPAEAPAGSAIGSIGVPGATGANGANGA
jgi:hypothetical protein